MKPNDSFFEHSSLKYLSLSKSKYLAKYIILLSIWIGHIDGSFEDQSGTKALKALFDDIKFHKDRKFFDQSKQNKNVNKEGMSYILIL